jgi:hypothetical protein
MDSKCIYRNLSQHISSEGNREMNTQAEEQKPGIIT